MRFPVGNNTDDLDPKWYNAQGYGEKTSYGYHEGDDFNLRTGGDSDLGQPVYAIHKGIVTSVHSHTTKPTFGKHIHVQHDGEWGTVYSHYAHLNDTLVVTGDVVEEGQVIGHLGKSGTDFAHLHFAIKNQPTGIDGIARTLDDLEKWENPTAFIKKWRTMPDTGKIEIDKATFEELVTKATKYDSLRDAGWATVEVITQTIDEYKRDNQALREERDRAIATVEERRKEWNELIAFLAKELDTRQDLQEIKDLVEKYDQVIGDLEDTKTDYANDKKKWAEAELEMKADIARLQALVDNKNVLENASMEDILKEIIRRLKKVLGGL